MLDQEKCWKAVEQRDASQTDFFFGVMTTGVYCRPSCPARLPLRKNVKFYRTPAEAERDGLRACLRCHPLATIGNDPSATRMNVICRYIESHSEEPLTLDELAMRAELSPFHFQRTFKAVVGLTPKQFIEAARLKKLKRSLRTSRNIAEAVYDVGFGSSSRVYERADTRLGMTPNQYRLGGQGINITHVTIETSLGLLMMGATDRGLCFLQFGDSAEELLETVSREYPKATLQVMQKPYSSQFNNWVSALTEHLKGGQPHLDLPIDVRATAFQMRVWRYLQSIPYGEVQSYSEVAKGIGQPTAVRAVARACASNTVALVIPCHRVIRGTGELGGYRWGLDRKRVLLDKERASRAGR